MNEAKPLRACPVLIPLLRQVCCVSLAQVTEQVLVIIGHLFFLMSPSKLKREVKRLTRWLMILLPTKVPPFYISQVIGVGVTRKSNYFMHSIFIEWLMLQSAKHGPQAKSSLRLVFVN